VWYKLFKDVTRTISKTLMPNFGRLKSVYKNSLKLAYFWLNY